MFFCFLCGIATAMQAQTSGHFKVRTDNFVQIGYDAYKSLTFGIGTSTPNNGNWAIEHWNGGLNFWKPWPTAPTRNYALFLQDNPAYVGIGKHPYQALDINGDVAVYGTIITYSDERLKRDVQRLTPQYYQQILQQLQTYSYHLTLDRLPTPVLETDDAVKQGTLAGDQAPTNYNQ